MRITALVLVVGCLAGTIGVNADPDGHSISGLRRANRLGPSQSVGGGVVWRVRASLKGSVVQRTSDSGRSWQDRTPPGFTHSAPDLNDGDNYPISFGLSALNSRQCWVACSESLRGRDVIAVERTVDGGQHWRRTEIAGGSRDVILQFLDTKHGFLLALGGPAAGEMSKEFYSTSDGGKEWTKGGSPDYAGGSHTPIGNYYPNGMAFRNTREGWITGTNHGDPAVPLIRTCDGGRTWAVQPILLPPPYENGGANTNQPRFYGKDHTRGAFTAYFIDSAIGSSRDVNYVTHDGGKHWRPVYPTRKKMR